MAKLAILGGGQMGEALLGGLLDAGWDADDLAVAEASADRRRHLEGCYRKVRVVPTAAWAVAEADVVVVAVKPLDVGTVLGGALATLAPGALVVSIAAGVTIARLEALVPGRPVVRVMPNMPALVRQGAAAIAGGSHATENHLSQAEGVLRAVGSVVAVPESLLDAVTGLSGSGPAYVFLLAEALIEAGVYAGLPRPVARSLVVQTLVGAAAMLAGTDASPEALRGNVTSPGGTTAAGLAALERRAVRAAFIEAVEAATARSRELGLS